MTLPPLLIKHWDRLRSSFWFLPSFMAVGAAGLSFGAVALDQALTLRWLRAQSWAYTGDAEGASLLLSTVAGSMVTITGLVFSMTLVALSLASSQLGPRLLRNFMRDTANQLVLGTFIATFVYCLLVLRTIRRADGQDAFVPHLSVSVGVLLALVSLGVLIYFIHHVSVSIQADEVVTRVGAELVEGIERLFPPRDGPGAASSNDAGPADAGLPQGFERGARAVGARADGYLQLVDADALQALAESENLVLRVERRPGDYLVRGRPLLRAWPAERLTGALADKACAAFMLGSQRTSVQDVEFAVDQLVEIAVRALSPGINDPFTAIACVDRLGSALCRLAQRGMPPARRVDAHGALRLQLPAWGFAGLLDASFDPIRLHARADVAVTVRLLDTLGGIAAFAHEPPQRAALRGHADKIARAALHDLREPSDRTVIETRRDAALRALQPGA